MGFDRAGRGREQGPGRPLVLGETAAEAAAGIERLGVALRRAVAGGRYQSAGSGQTRRCSLVHWVPVLRDLAGIGAVLIEADGAARLPLKAPAAYEPVLPESATLVIAMCGLEAQWVPLDEEHVHRASLLADLLDLEPGRPIPPEALLRALVLGYHDRVPLHARLVCLFNKADAYPPTRSSWRPPTGLPSKCGWERWARRKGRSWSVYGTWSEARRRGLGGGASADVWAVVPKSRSNSTARPSWGGQ